MTLPWSYCHSIVNIKWAMYALVVLLNINIVMASVRNYAAVYHHGCLNLTWIILSCTFCFIHFFLLCFPRFHEQYGAERTEGYRSIVGGLNGLEDDQYKGSLYISLVLATLNLIGYVIIVFFLGITEVPIIIRRMDGNNFCIIVMF